MKRYDYNKQLFFDIEKSKDKFNPVIEVIKWFILAGITIAGFSIINTCFNLVNLYTLMNAIIKTVFLFIPFNLGVNTIRYITKTLKKYFAEYRINTLCDEIYEESDVDIDITNIQNAISEYEFNKVIDYDSEHDMQYASDKSIDTFYLLDNEQKIRVLRQVKECIERSPVNVDESSELFLLEDDDIDNEKLEEIQKKLIRK